VVEAPWYEDQPLWPWPVAERKPFTFIRLTGSLTSEEVGSIIAQLVAFNQIEADPTLEALLQGAIAEESLVLPGGIQASSGTTEINPSCCCGLEEWQDWLTIVSAGTIPWLGHDPWPWMETSDGNIHIWSDGGFVEVSDAFSIVFTEQQLMAELARVERDLRVFLSLVGTWAQNMKFSDPTALCLKLDSCFHLGGPDSM
jgi:hypothetical protein